MYLSTFCTPLYFLEPSEGYHYLRQAQSRNLIFPRFNPDAHLFSLVFDISCLGECQAVWAKARSNRGSGMSHESVGVGSNKLAVMGGGVGGGVTRAGAMTSDRRLLHKGQSLIPPRTELRTFLQVLTNLVG